MRRLLIALVTLAALAAQNAFAQCCGMATDGSSCKTLTVETAESNAGCMDDGMGNCVGGTIINGSGCACVAGNCFSTTVLGVTDSAEQCTDESAFFCCFAGQGQNCPTPIGVNRPPTCKLPATGQTISYVKGDDGDVRAGGALSFTVNHDGTITDNNTGLMWERKHKLEGLQLPDKTDLHGTYNCYPWQGFCSGSGRECGTDADCGGGEFCAASDCQGGFPNGLTAFKWVALLNAQHFAGYDDWRIPNVKELASIENYGNAPAVSPEFYDGICSTNPFCVGTDVYWASTTFKFIPQIAWGVSWSGMVVAVVDKAGGLPAQVLARGPPNGSYVRAVRGESCGLPATGQNRMVVRGEDGLAAFGAPLSYTDNHDGTITDNVTGLMWEKKVGRDGLPDPANLDDADNRYFWRGFCSGNGAECGTDADCQPGPQTCDAADGQAGFPNGTTIFKWVAALNAQNFAGHNDWRMPNAKELQSIVNYGVVNPSVSAAFNGASCRGTCTDLTDPACSCTVSASYWSTTTSVAFPGTAWNVDFDQGAVGGHATLGFDEATGVGTSADFGKPVTGYVRAVRGGL